MRINNNKILSLLTSTDFSGKESHQLHSRIISPTKKGTKTLSSRWPPISQMSGNRDDQSAGIPHTWCQLSGASARPKNMTPRSTLWSSFVPKETVGKSSKSKERGEMAITDCENVVDVLEFPWKELALQILRFTDQLAWWVYCTSFVSRKDE